MHRWDDIMLIEVSNESNKARVNKLYCWMTCMDVSRLV